jgi:hypothetical protein
VNLTINKEKYSFFVDEQAHDLPIFFHYSYLDAVTQGNWDGLVIEEDNSPIAIFIIHQKIKFGFKCIINPPLSPYCGLWVASNYSSKANKIIPFLAAYLKDKYSYINFTLHHTYKSHLPWAWEGFHQNQKMTMTIANKDSDQVFDQYEKVVKSDIRNAHKSLQIGLISDLEAELPILTKGLLMSGMNKERASKIIIELSKLPQIKLYKAYDQNGTTHGAILIAQDNKNVYNLINGRSEKSSRGAMSMLMDHVIKYAMSSEKTFDFEGSTLPGVYQFFKSFNPEITTYHQLYKSRYKVTDTLIKTMGLV